MRNIAEQNVNEANNNEEEELEDNPENESIEGNENESEPCNEETREMRLNCLRYLECLEFNHERKHGRERTIS